MKALLLTLLILTASQAPGLRLTIYGDGVVAVEQVVEGGLEVAELSIPLLSENPVNVEVYGLGGEPLPFRIEDGVLVVELYGLRWAEVYYETMALTEKKAEVWRLVLNLTEEAEVIFPPDSTIIYLNAPPREIGVEAGSPRLLLQPGSWEVDYVLNPVSHVSSPQPQPLLWWLIGAGIVAAFSSALFLKLRAKAVEGELNTDERRVLELVKARGRVSEAEIREVLGLPKTTAWRIVRRLERRGLVKVRKIGGRNEVEPA